MAAHKYSPGDYVRERSSPYAPGRVLEVHSVTETGLPRVIRASDGVQKVLRDCYPATRADWDAQCAQDQLERARARMFWKMTRAETTDDGRDRAAREWLTYRGWTVTPPVAKEAT